MTNDRRWFSPPLYGMPNFADLFTARQLITLTNFSDLVGEARATIRENATLTGFPCDDNALADGGTGSRAYADAIATYLAFCVDKNTLTNCTLATWQNSPDRLTQALGRQALPMSWDYAEANPLSQAGGGYVLTLQSLGEVLERLPHNQMQPAFANQVDAAVLARSLTLSPMISTDPPYYDNIGYADLSDWFYVWLRKTIGHLWPALFATVLTPKAEELIATPNRHNGNRIDAQQFFEQGLEAVFNQLRLVNADGFPVTVYYAFKQSEMDEDDDDSDTTSDANVTASTGWETMLEGLSRAGFSITGTWPVRTELVTSLKKDVGAPGFIHRPRLPSSSRQRIARDSQRVHRVAAARVAGGAAESATREHRAGGPCAGGDRAGDGRLHPLCQGDRSRRIADDCPHGAWNHQPVARRSACRAGR